MTGIDLLSDKAIKAALRRAQVSSKPVGVNDGGGLTLEAQPTGVGWWRLRYWVAGKASRLSVGTYPDTSLAQARRKREEARKLLASGSDPSEAKKAEKAEAMARAGFAKLVAAGKPLPGSFEFVANEWLDKVHRAKVSEGHAERTQVRLKQDVFPWIGSRPIGEVEAPELLKLLRRVEGRGAIETTHRVKYVCGQVFRYGIATGDCSRNPAADLRDALRPVQTRHHAALVDPYEVAKLLKDMDGYSGSAITKAALTLSALLLLRPGELRHMEWAWLNLEGSVLTVPSEAMKRTRTDKLSGPPHVVPLPRQAVTVFETLKPLTGTGRFVFPALTTSQRCMSENTVRSALRRLGYGNEDMTAHGFRATARTMIAERLGFMPEIIEAQLAHVVGDSLGRAYNRTQYLQQRREMMQAWADYVDQLRSGAWATPIGSRRKAHPNTGGQGDSHTSRKGPAQRNDPASVLPRREASK
ncbi:integrase [Paucibacter sp. KBW04]|uniref:tyrosine-type recombinase/integrase n=1 Tax=Paucibacter sp. KBW04 TaxID=2153361 RepID=UPI000F58734B|nr:integrase arm-type DNA-binding domain-containing protein [Paucibacter sp. KBW04]RQO63577.1 integrase [Paucibacter sp. KBW04]